MNFENDEINTDNTNHSKSDIMRLKIILLITSAYIVVEILAGIFTNSLALLSDAGHMLTDAAGIGFALFAITFASKKALTPQKTYGFYRLEIL
ncbi:MAG TPA: cation transporter, partial [Nitrososphaeraceae archaeon]|nr:cation transporter [Nitrososphaeraceae archaeon]